MKPTEEKIKLENLRIPTEMEIDTAGKTYEKFYKWRNYRSGALAQFQRDDFETVLRKSRELFWNALKTPSDDLKELGIEFSLPYVRNEVLNFVGRITSQHYNGHFNGDGLDIFGVKVLQGIFDKWCFKNNEKVESFWEVLYGVVNGTTCRFIGYNDGKLTRRYLDRYDQETGNYIIKEKDEPYWNDVWAEQVPIEDIYLPKIYERNFQRQGRMIWKTEMDWKDFRREFRSYDNAEFVYPGNMIAEDSLYYRMLGGTGVMSGNKIQLIKMYDWIEDEYIIFANGILLNAVGKGKKQATSPMPWDHKMGPFTWGILSPLDEKLAYGMPLPFLIKEPHRIMNVANTMLMEHELRNVSPAILSSDFDAPKIIFGRHDVISVNDVDAYKELKLSDPSNAFFSMLNGVKASMSDTAQGGSAPMTPSKQPKSAREVLQLESLKQAAMGITLTMYYDILRQKMLLVVKTALQFYQVNKYAKEQTKIIRALKIPNTSLSTGGVGEMQIRIVPKRGKDFDHKGRSEELFFESIQQAMLNGKMTEILEVPVDYIQNLEFEITSIDMEPENSDAMRKAEWNEGIGKRLIEVYVPQGIADLGKVYLRDMEKNGEHPSDYASEKALPQLLSSWGEQQTFKPPEGKGAQENVPSNQGNLQQSGTGMKFGGNNTSPLPINT